jgi:hypothetical protein
MTQKVCAGALLKCSCGLAPTALNVLPDKKVLTQAPTATIMDNKPMVNVPTFGMCNSPANPAVAAAISSSMGAVTVAPCIPVLPAPWVPGAPTVLVGNQPALTKDSKLICAYAGVIEITMPGQMTTKTG